MTGVKGEVGVTIRETCAGGNVQCLDCGGG